MTWTSMKSRETIFWNLSSIYLMKGRNFSFLRLTSGQQSLKSWLLSSTFPFFSPLEGKLHSLIQIELPHIAGGVIFFSNFSPDLGRNGIVVSCVFLTFLKKLSYSVDLFPGYCQCLCWPNRLIGMYTAKSLQGPTKDIQLSFSRDQDFISKCYLQKRNLFVLIFIKHTVHMCTHYFPYSQGRPVGEQRKGDLTEITFPHLSLGQKPCWAWKSTF